MIREIDIRLPVGEADNTQARMREVVRVLHIRPERLRGLRLLKESIDARQHVIRKQLRCLVAIDEPLPPEESLPGEPKRVEPTAKRVIIVGAGPAGLFAALKCSELGVRPIVLERGKDVSARRSDLRPINCEGRVTGESNYCFGEGGAGAFSDGKLYTRATKRGDVAVVYRQLVAHGANTGILTEAHPHIGSDKLPRIIQSIRASILRAGGEMHFGTRVTGLLRSADGRKARGVRTADGREWEAEGVILATGHSARDVYEMLVGEGLTTEKKAFAVGVRIEHPQSIIDEAMYHLRPGTERPSGLPAARYSVAATVNERGVYSFCMCPGGFIVPAMTRADELVVNGMSLSRRDSPWANAGLVVTVLPEDTEETEYGGLTGMYWQRHIEQLAAVAGGGDLKAPAQRVPDFLAHRDSRNLRACNYRPGVTSCNLWDVLPVGICERLALGLRCFEEKIRGFTSTEALLIGAETRTSSPVRIPRNPETLQHPELARLFPCAEGAGYAGGIVSAAMDGMRCAEAACR